jgi:hypothetical protein
MTWCLLRVQFYAFYVFEVILCLCYFYFLSSLTQVGILHSSVPDGLIGPRTSVVLILDSSSEFGI